jgi:competence protein ComEC
MDGRLLGVTAAACVLAALIAPSVPAAAAVLFLLLGAVSRRPEPVAVGLVLLVGARADASESALERPLPPDVAGVAALVTDPEPGRFGSRAEVRMDGRRYRLEVGRDHEAVLRSSLTGDHLVVRGRVRAFRDAPAGWVRSRHLAGRIVATRVARGPPAAPWYRLANGVHRTLAAGARSIDDDRRPLYLGLVVGDDRGQSDAMRFHFRAAGLSHLLAVSGQNVVFLLVVAAPLLQRLPLRSRWCVVVVLLAGFVLVTRAEPSVLRATAMGLVAVTATTAGRTVSAVRSVGWCVVGLLVVDPMLVHAIGFRLSVAATLGLVTVARPIAERLPGPGWLREPLGVTLAAQLATAPILLAFTPGIPPIAVPANLLAVPAAGAVMVLGLSAGVLAGLVREDVAVVLQLPTRSLLAWVDAVARTAASLPIPPLDTGRLVALAALVAAVCLLRHRVHGACAIALTVAVALLSVAVVAPPTLSPGRHRAGPASVVVDACGAREVVVAGGRADRVLEGLWAIGVTRAAIVVMADEGGGGTVAAEVAAELGASVVDRSEAPGEWSGGACRLPP